jgi:predicted alpha/beta-hydrolase family hydrolase
VQNFLEDRLVSSTVSKLISIAVNDAVRLLTPRQARACYVLAHGAGAGMNHPFMVAVAAGLARRGIATVRYQLTRRFWATRSIHSLPGSTA